MKVVSENRASTLVISMESVMINHWISGNLLLDKTKVQDMELPPRQDGPNINEPTETDHSPSFIQQNRCFHMFSMYFGASLKLFKDSGFFTHSAAESTSSGIESTAFLIVEASESSGQPGDHKLLVFGWHPHNLPQDENKRSSTTGPGSNRKKACNCLLPVVPHKAVAEVSKIGNL